MLIATAGVLPPDPVARLVRALVDPDGTITVLNVTQSGSDSLDEIEGEVWQAFRPARFPPGSMREDREGIRYAEERGAKMVAPIVAALRSQQLNPQTRFVESDDVAKAIIESSEDLGVDLIVMGATRRLFKEMSWTSVSMTVSAHSRLPVLLIPAPPGTDSLRPGNP